VEPSPSAPLERDARDDVWAQWPGAVLLDDEITYYCTQATPPLIAPFDRRQLKPARYQLRLGGQARINGENRAITPQQPLVIKPHQVAVVQTLERLNIPRFLIGRWNLRVNMVYRGLLWVGALQVDPGWIGYLPCPLYNMSDKEVELLYGEEVFTIDFVRTTRFIPNVSKPYRMKFDPNPEIAIFDSHRLKSGPYETLAKVDALTETVTEIRKYVDTFITFMIAALGIIVAAIGVIAAAPTRVGAALGSPGVAVGVAFFAIVIALAAFNLGTRRAASYDSPVRSSDRNQ
jgi:deoxycytidine triphosphate deaminase